MKTMTTQMGKRSIALAVAVACVTALPVHAEETVTIRQSASKQESIGVVTGLAVGAVAGGPSERSSEPPRVPGSVIGITSRLSRGTSWPRD